MNRPALLALVILTAGCGGGPSLVAPAAPRAAEVGVELDAADEVVESGAPVPREPLAGTPDASDLIPDALSPLSGLVEELDPAGGLPDAPSIGPAPVGLRIESIGVAAAAVRSVGVEGNGDMEIPPATEVGWYGFGPSPGEAGSAVLAAHIAADGVDGVFRRLTDAEAGDLIEVVFDDGATRKFEIVELVQYDKRQLPFDDLFSRDGDPRLALITCGGDFNPSIRSYEENVVAYAVPV